MTQEPIPIREQTRNVVRSLIAKTALTLFAEHGYDATTIEQVASAAGVSRRTLFNYFANKEDLALSGLSEQGEIIAQRFAERPTSEDVWHSLRAAFGVLDEIETTTAHRLEFMRVIFGSVALRAGNAEKQWQWQQLLAPLVAKRMPRNKHRALQSNAISATAIACLHTSMEQWLNADGKGTLMEYWDLAIAAVKA